MSAAFVGHGSSAWPGSARRPGAGTDVLVDGYA